MKNQNLFIKLTTFVGILLSVLSTLLFFNVFPLTIHAVTATFLIGFILTFILFKVDPDEGTYIEFILCVLFSSITIILIMFSLFAPNKQNFVYKNETKVLIYKTPVSTIIKIGESTYESNDVAVYKNVDSTNKFKSVTERTSFYFPDKEYLITEKDSIVYKLDKKY